MFPPRRYPHYLAVLIPPNDNKPPKLRVPPPLAALLQPTTLAPGQPEIYATLSPTVRVRLLISVRY